VVVVADRSANPEFIAADLIAQAEHDEEAQAICITPDESIIPAVRAALERRLASAMRREIAVRSLEEKGAFLLVNNLSHAADIVNTIAPEHLEVMVKDPRKFIAKVRNAGAIFVGPWSSEAFGDYLAGPNHTLPTLGTARFSSALSVSDFLRFTNIIELSKAGALSLGRHVEVLAAAEGLDGHAASARARRESV
jgi:histidinol dehydrogenase